MFTSDLNRFSRIVRLPDTSKVRIKEAYRDYIPSVDVRAIVHQLLRTVPDKYLMGLDCVLLTNESALPRKDRVGKVRSRKRMHDKSCVVGRYHHGSRGDPPYIELRVDKIVAGMKGMPLRIQLIREGVFGHVLFHELGHHIHRTVRPEHTETEDLADTWARKLGTNFIRTKYWYALPVLVPAFKIYRFMRRRHWI